MKFTFECSLCGHIFDEQFVAVQFDDKVGYRAMQRRDADTPQQCPVCNEFSGMYSEAATLEGARLTYTHDDLWHAESVGAPIVDKNSNPRLASKSFRGKGSPGVERCALSGPGTSGRPDRRQV